MIIVLKLIMRKKVRFYMLYKYHGIFIVALIKYSFLM